MNLMGGGKKKGSNQSALSRHKTAAQKRGHSILGQGAQINGNAMERYLKEGCFRKAATSQL
jgi:hypothetical protein